MLQHGDKLRFGGGIRGTNAYSDRFTYIFEKEAYLYRYEPAPSSGLQPDSSTVAGRQADEAAERAVILVELEKEKEGGAPGHWAGRGRGAAWSNCPVGSARARLLHLPRACLASLSGCAQGRD